MSESNKTLVLGASPRETRYSFLAVLRLRAAGHEVVAVGNRAGLIGDVPIVQEFPGGGIHTVSVYLNAKSQAAYYEKILALRPQRVVFNPGAENSAFAEKLLPVLKSLGA